MNKIKKFCIPIVTACLIMNSMTFPALAKSEIPADSEILKYLYCSSNQLTSLDVSQNTALEEFDCSSNQLTRLDVRNCPKILEFIKTGKK